MTSAMLSVALCTPECWLFTSWSSASVWLSVPSAFLMQVLPSGSVDAYSASKRAPMDFATFCVMPRTSSGTSASRCSASSALPSDSRACRASPADE